MQRDSRIWLADAVAAANAVLTFTTNRSLADYRGDLLLRSAVERQFEILGEALGQLAKTAPSERGEAGAESSVQSWSAAPEMQGAPLQGSPLRLPAGSCPCPDRPLAPSRS
jgi:hypothetical protein